MRVNDSKTPEKGWRKKDLTAAALPEYMAIPRKFRSPYRTPLMQFIADWNKSSDKAALIAAEPCYDGEDSLLLPAIAAVVHALCDRDGISVPAWVWSHRSDEDLTVFGWTMDTELGRIRRAVAPEACHYHRVFFDYETLDKGSPKQWVVNTADPRSYPDHRPAQTTINNGIKPPTFTEVPLTLSEPLAGRKSPIVNTKPSPTATKAPTGTKPSPTATKPATGTKPSLAGVGLPLAGMRVVVCRPADQAGPLVEGLRAVGAEVVNAPVIAINDPADGGSALRSAMRSLARGDWLVVTSPNGAARAAAAVVGPLPDGVRVAAIGTSTAQRAAEMGLPVHMVPERSTGEGLLEALQAAESRTSTRRAVLARAAVARSALPDGLRKAGWEVCDVPAYRTVGAPLSNQLIRQVVSSDAVVFTSSSTVKHLVAQVGIDAVPQLVVSIGPITTATATRLGLEVSVEAAEQTIQSVIDSLCQHVSTTS